MGLSRGTAVTSKLQLTVPKAIADQYGIRPGDELQWIAAGEALSLLYGLQTCDAQG